jgi:hypothetical protein
MTQKQIQALILNGPDKGLVVAVTPEVYLHWTGLWRTFGYQGMLTYRIEKLTYKGKTFWAGSANKDLTVSQMLDLAKHWGWVDNEAITYAADHFSDYQA